MCDTVVSIVIQVMNAFYFGEHYCIVMELFGLTLVNLLKMPEHLVLAAERGAKSLVKPVPRSSSLVMPNPR